MGARSGIVCTLLTTHTVFGHEKFSFLRTVLTTLTGFFLQFIETLIRTDLGHLKATTDL